MGCTPRHGPTDVVDASAPRGLEARVPGAHDAPPSVDQDRLAGHAAVVPHHVPESRPVTAAPGALESTHVRAHGVARGWRRRRRWGRRRQWWWRRRHWWRRQRGGGWWGRLRRRRGWWWRLRRRRWWWWIHRDANAVRVEHNPRRGQACAVDVAKTGSSVRPHDDVVRSIESDCRRILIQCCRRNWNANWVEHDSVCADAGPVDVGVRAKLAPCDEVVRAIEAEGGRILRVGRS